MTDLSEKDLQAAVIELANLYGWTVSHFRAAQNSRGDWRTPVAAQGKGFPDLTMLRGSRIVVAELKSARGKVTREQGDWLLAWRQTAAEVFVWYPADWLDGTIEKALR